MRPNAPDTPDFYKRVWAIVARIPYGKVTTYGHIARALGATRSARLVGWALHAAAGTELPCHRVVNREGRLTGKQHFPTPTWMEERLRSEGIHFREPDQVDLEKHLWIPPSSP